MQHAEPGKNVTDDEDTLNTKSPDVVILEKETLYLLADV